MSKNKIILLAVLALMTLGGVAVFSLPYLKAPNIPTVPEETNPAVQNPVTSTNTPIDQNTGMGSENTSSVFIATSTLLAGEDISPLSLKYSDLPKDLFAQNFTWQKPEKTTNLGVLVSNYATCDGPGCPWYSEKDSAYYRVASFSYQQQAGEIVLLPVNQGSYNGYNFEEYYFVNFNNTLTLLEKNSTSIIGDNGLNKVKFTVDKNLSLPANTDIPKEINITGKQKLYLEGNSQMALFLDDLESGGIKREKIANFNNKDIWNCGDFFATFTNNLEGVQPVTYNIRLPKIFNLNNGLKYNVASYDSKRNSGCGGRKGLNVITDLKDSDLEKAGTADDGNVIFKYKDISEGTAMSELFKNYNGYLESSNVPTTTYDKFLSDSPLIIMKDGFGRYIEFVKSKYFIQIAECGKPVIYLYPTKDTQVNVQVKPNGGLTKVDPFYPTDGWLVNAKPTGELTNTDGLNYPYLFWEGTAYDMKVPTDGFVLKRENIKRDMTKLLARLGLNQKETTDFLEFWQTKLEVKPYVFVTFVAQTDFDKVAPLNISPRPDKTIRVFMDYQPLDMPFNSRPLKIETPTRTGFTVVEWGGRLHQ